MSRSTDRLLSPVGDRLRHALRRQSVFSGTTALGCAYFAALAGAHLLSHAHTPAQAAPEMTVLLFSLVAMLVALIAGRRLPRWVGILTVVLLSAAFAVVVSSAPEAGTVLGVLFLVPLLMVYLGWSYQPWPARGVGAVVLGLWGVAIVNNPHFAERALSDPWPLLYGGLVCMLVLEISLALGEDLARAVRTDPLTGALNRRGLRRHMREARQRGGQYWLVVADIDGLKPLNDRHGHAAGDALLRATVESWRVVLADEGVVARWGGDEFVIMFRAEGEAAARRVSESLRKAAPQPYSAGLVRVQDGVGVDFLVRLADEELYREKRERRGTGVPTEPTPVPAPDATRARPWSALVSCAAALLYVVTAVVGLLAATDFWEIVTEVAAILVGLVAIVVAARLGDRYPHGGVLAWVGLMAVVLMARAVARDDAGGVIEMLFCLQLFAVIAGWFYRGRVGRAFLLGLYVVLVGALPLISSQTLGRLGPIPIVVALATAWLLLEVVRGVRVGERRLAATDPLTGVLNRYGFDEALAAAIETARRRGRPLSVVTIDFDRFKELNDKQGHDAGDRVLRGAVQAWRHLLRTDDVIGRLGGDEFVVVLPGARAAEAESTIARVHAESDGGWSWGVAELRDDDEITDLIDRADQALYAAKRAR
ncbi:GGDEF domain-containing protein [Microbacterium sediminis]|nr:GGDEF domain-containing protein [Microbacterium sediminis]